MRWLLLLLLLLGLVGAVAKNGCHVREFYGIGYTVHDPTQRHKEMMAWLIHNAEFCKTSDLRGDLEQPVRVGGHGGFCPA
jgi:hypothetical protein